ncbi:hypothetical protein Ami103574_02600 [Aminipila butyrica]|uniref:Uncharacterized protein n=1 Tax=Aminipila butyrica TaxID=433296 RepID=A0A858BST3_9FIRM|nr:hypothetical protein [Aminipila butyrica]QIB68269.1 hypothetical protein Ami103574_02600 [Aminipila butyrica]
MAGTIAGSLIFDTKTNTDGFNDGTKNIKKMTESISDSLNDLGKAVVAAFSVAAIKEFVQTLVETTANLQALDAQFNQIFKGAEGEAAMAAINQQSEELGIHVDLLKQAFSSFGAQLKGAGLDAQKTLEGTTKATSLAADAAAFYDMSLETTSASLASFLKGNFEAGDAIKVFTTASQMSTKAVEVYGKSWDKLTEAEKQWLLLDKVQEVFELNGAVGQATREQDNWATSMGNLKATWDRFLENIGTGTLDAVNTAVQNITAAISGLTDFMKNNTGAIDAFKISIEALTTALVAYFIVANKWTILQKFLTITIQLESAMKLFGAALASPAGRLGIVVGILTLFIGLALKADEVWGNMTGMEKAAYVLGTVALAAGTLAIAFGAVQSAASWGAAGLAIAAGTLAIGAAISRAQKQAEAGMVSSGGVRLPRLATGAVIPPNSEFLAILGDQKHGTNIEAPLSTIEQAVDNALSRRGNAGGTSGSAVAVFNIDGREFARAMAPYTAGENMRQGTRLINGVI